MRRFLGLCVALLAFMAVHARAATNPDAIAVIIGNRNYTGRDVPEVKYADRDAQAMKRYVIDVLGYDEKNVIYVENAAQSRMLALFGTEQEPGIVSRWLRKDGSSDLFVYYSGHGVPGLKDGQSYLLPVDGDPSAGQLNGYALKLLYANLEKTTARSITVLLDACFAGQSGSGAALIRNASVLVRPADPTPKAVSQRMTVIAASGADEVANWDDADKHGLFTEYFLRAVYGAADSPKYGGKGDGHVTVAAVRSFLDKEMSYFAGREIGRDQNATVSGDEAEVLATFQPGTPLVRPSLGGPVKPAVLNVPAAPVPTPTPLPPPAYAPPVPYVAPPAPSASVDDLLRNGLNLRQQRMYDQAVENFRQAANGGSAAAMTALGDAYATGHGVPKDDAQALYWYRKSAQLGNASAMNHVGYATDHGLGVTADPVEALKWFRWSSERGDPDGTNNLGYAYMNGRGVEKNPTEALRYYNKAAELGSSAAMFNLGDAYNNSRGVIRDSVTALTWYRKAADAGNMLAMNFVGQAYENGNGTAQDLAQSVVWYRKGADLGDRAAMSNLGYALENGRGVARDDAEAVRWYRGAVDLGEVSAMYELGQMYRFGRVGPVDMTAATQLLRRASDAGNDEARKALGEMQAALAPPPVSQPAYTPPTAADPAAVETALNLTQQNRIALQQGLTMLNYATGGADGEFGPMTRQAILGYQRHIAVAATGYLTRETVERLVAEIKAKQAGLGTPATPPPPPPSGPMLAASADERQDFGIQPQTWLQGNVGSPTPTTIPGGARVVATAELVRALNTPSQTPFVMVDVLDGAPHGSIRGAIRMPLAGHGGTFTDTIQQTVVTQLAQASGGRKDTPLVFFCAGVRCWESYNAALRAMRAGYQRVYWYRGGLEAWGAAGQPTG